MRYLVVDKNKKFSPTDTSVSIYKHKGFCIYKSGSSNDFKYWRWQ